MPKRRRPRSTSVRTSWTSSVSQTAQGSLAAVVRHVNGAGSVAKVHLAVLDSATELAVEVSRERLAELSLKSGERVYVSPRRTRVFLPDYSI